MDLQSYLGIVKRWAWLLVLGTLLGAGTLYFTERFLDLAFLPDLPIWQATARLAVGAETGGREQDQDTLDLGRSLAGTYAELIRQRPISENVVNTLGLPISVEDLEETVIEVVIPPQTQIVEITATYGDPQLAADIANEAARQLVAMAPVRPRGFIQIIAEAEVPESQLLDPYTVIILAGVFGFLLCGGIVFLIEYLNNTIRSIDDVTNRLRLPCLGSIKPNGEGVETHMGGQHVWWSVIQACRKPEGETGGKFILITSPGAEGGKTVAAINLAVVWAKMGQKTILVDAHLRHPILHEWLDLSSDVGLSNLLQENGDVDLQARLNEALCLTRIADLMVLPSGLPSSDPVGLLSSRRLEDLLHELAKQAEVIIIDGPPILPAADVAILASKVNGILLVLDASRTTMSTASEALESLRMVGGKVFGAVLNELGSKDLESHDYRHLTMQQ